MKRRKQLLAVLLSVSVAVPNTMLMAPVVQAQEAQVKTTAETGATFSAVTKTSYASATITWGAVDGATSYKVYRKDTKNTEYTLLTQQAITATSYTDTTVTEGVQYTYQVKAYQGDTEIKASVESSDSVSVGLEAVKKYAALAVELTGDEQSFDGTRFVDCSDKAEAVKAVNTGSIIIRFRADNGNSAGVMLGTKDSSIAPTTATGSDCTSIFVNNNTGIRFAFKHTVAGKTPNNNITDGEWHTMVLSSLNTPSSDGKTKAMRLTVDGQELWINETATNAGMFAKQNVLDKVTIGGHVNASGQIANGFKGDISYVIVTSEVISDEEAIAISNAGWSGKDRPGSAISTMLDNTYGDNSWVFTGGEAVAGGWNQNQGARNYMGQFEEYVRFKIAGNNEYGRQRYVFNTGRAGNSLTEVLEDYEELVTAFAPKAVAYMVGPEDYEKGDSEEVLQQFQNDLKTFIDNSIAIKTNNGGFAVIQKPFAVADDATNTVIAKYNEAIDTVVSSYANDTAKYLRILVVDHFTQTNNAEFKDTCLTADGFLNAHGHLKIGEQLSIAVCGSVSSYPNSNVNLNLVPTAQPEEYLDIMPGITATATTLAVSIPESEQGPWTYQVTTEDVTVKGNAQSNTFSITALPEGKAYTLKIQSQDGKRQLVTMKGTLAEGNQAVKDSQQLDELQQKLADVMAEKDAMTWLFMGDSITHASNFNYGYVGLSEIFEKFLRDDLDRKKDVVLNTAIYGTTLEKTLNNIQQRLTNYTPDVVTVMLGTNDSNATVESTQYVARMKQMIQEIRRLNEDAVIVLRTPIPTLDEDQASPNQNRLNNLPGYIEALKTIAAEEDCILLDQYDNWKAELQTYSWMRTKGRDFIFGDFLHPNPRGQLLMFRRFVNACGLWTEDSYMTNLFYEMPITEQENTIKPSVRVTSTLGVSMSVDNLRAVSGLSLGQVTLSLTDKETGKSYESTVEIGATNVVLPTLPVGVYEAEVTGYLTNAATHVTFAKQDITISEQGYEASAKQLLQTMIASAETQDAEAYTADSWTAFRTALASAKVTYAKENATMEEIEAAITALETATIGLISKATKIQGVTVSQVGTQNSTSGNESAAAALDGQSSTFWHSNYSNNTDKASYDNHWVTFDLGKNYMLNKLRYLSRPTGQNGNIKKYEIYASLDGNTFEKISEGNWAGSPATWYEADFEAKETRYVKIKVLEATSGNNDKFSSAAEFEFIGYEKTETTETVREIILNKNTLALTVGTEETLQVTVTPENEAIRWESSDSTVATVVNGKVTALKAGTTTITVSTEDGEKTATCVVTVTDNNSGSGENEGGNTPGGDQGGNEGGNQQPTTHEHTYGEVQVTKAPTCTEKGEGTKTCTVEGCGHSETVEVAANGHAYATTFTVDKAATCTEAGSQSKHCANCDATAEVTAIPVIAHTSDIGVITKQPTATTKGEKTYSCTVCKTVVKTEEIAATGTGDTTTPGTGDTTKPGDTTTPGTGDTTKPGDTTTPGTSDTTKPTLPKKGEKIVVNGVTYKVTKAAIKGGTVTFVSAKKNSAAIVVPATIKKQGITYNVTSVEKNAFKNQKKATKITIGKNVTKIGATAFANCTKLKNIKIQSAKFTKKSLVKTTFKGVKTSVKISVPKAKLKAYKTLFKKAGLSSKVKVTK